MKLGPAVGFWGEGNTLGNLAQMGFTQLCPECLYSGMQGP